MHRPLCALLALCFAALPSFAAITGVVMTSDGQPISGARVSIRAFESNEAMRMRLLSAAPDAVPIASTQTDSKGTFTLDSPREPAVDLSIFARGHEPQQRRIERDEEVGAIVLPKAEMRKATITAGGKPVPNALVVVNYGHEYAMRTDEQGRYEAPDPKRARSIAVIHPDYAIHEETLMGMSGASASALNRTLTAGTAFKGRVVSGEDTPVAQAAVFVDGWQLATTADDGTFTIAHMPLKWASMTARKDTLLGHRAFAKEPSATIRVAKAATISGRVTDAKTRVPVAGAVVRASTRRFSPGTDTSITTQTDAKGAYSLVVPAGTYTLLPSHPGYVFKASEASAIAGQQASKDISLAPLARVSGVVVDESKRPVVVAAIDSESAENARFGMPPRMMRGGDMIVSGPDGRFTIRVQPDQELWVRATKRGFPSAKSDAFSVAAGERKTGVALTIPSGIAVSGKVVDTNGDPLSGVAVTAMEVDPGQRGMMFRTFIGGMPGMDDDSVRTASDGTFTMRVKEGTYDFGFAREGLAPKTVRGQTISVTSSPMVEATMEPAVEIAGRVTRDGVGIENVSIAAMVPGTGGSSTITGPDGSFTLTGLAPGSVRIMARKQDDFIQEQRNVTAPARDVQIDVRAGGRISGRVVEKGSGKPIQTFQAGITTSRGGGGMVMMAPPQLRNFTSDDGSFTLDSVPAGAMVVVASAPGYASTRLNLNVEEGKEITGVELQLETGVKLVGRVTGPNGSPLSDVEVRVIPSPTGSYATRGSMDMSTATDANGEYSFDGLEAGEESVSFSHPKYSATRKSVTLKGRETRLDAQMTTGGRVAGTVVTESGAPVADAQVEAQSSSGYEVARTNANGAFEFDSVAPGRYRFTANKIGLAEGVLTDVDVTSGAPVRIVMKSGGTIYGRINGLTEQELAQTQVEAFSDRTSSTGTVDAKGNYRIEGVASGTAQIQAWTGAFGGAMRRAPTQSVDIAAGGSQQVDITFRGDIVVSGRVSRNGMPLAGGQVNFYPRGSSQRGSGGSTIDNNGQYSVTGLEDGEYNVMVADSQRGMSPYTTTYQVRGSATYDIDYKTNALRGRVLDVGTNEPLANVTVSLRATSTATDGPRFGRSGLTDATGAFIIDAVPPGNYTATATKEGFANDSKDVYVGDSAPADLEMRLARTAGLTLSVVDARDGRTLSARAIAFDMQGRVADETRMMFGGADSGNVTLNVAPGSYNVTVMASGYAPRQMTLQSPSTQPVALSPGGTLELRSKHNEPRRIRLIDANGTPYPRYSTILPSRDLLPSPGTTTWSYIAAGTYTLQLLNGDAVVDSKRIVVAEGQTAKEEI
jgi:protocatechuate 3,4-dioxygenase beta subunit